MSDVSTAAPMVTAAEVAEHERRLEALRALMAQHGFDAIVATDDHSIHGLAPNAPKHQPPYARYLSNFHIPSALHPHGTTVLVPLDGEPVLLLPPGIQRSFLHLAERRSWIRNIADLYVDDPEWEVRTRWGWMAADTTPATVELLRTAGLERGRIGVAGAASEFTSFASELPEAQFEPTLTAEGVDLLESLVSTNSPWEIEQLRIAHRAGDAMTRAFIATAVGGGSVREARAEAQAAAVKAGGDDFIMFGSIGVDPWTYWDWSLPADEQFHKDRLYFFQVAICAVNGYEIQSARSFVVGSAQPVHEHIQATMEQTLQAIHAQIGPGVTGGELFETGMGVVDAAGLALWGQLGHGMGYKAHSAPRGTALVPGQTTPLVPGQALVLHTCVVDHANNETGMLGDTILIGEDGGFNFAAQDPLPAALATTA